MFFNKNNLLSYVTILLAFVSVNSKFLERRAAFLSVGWANENLENMRKNEVNPKIKKVIQDNKLDPFHFGRTTLFQESSPFFNMTVTAEKFQGINAFELKPNGLYFSDEKGGFKVNLGVIPQEITGFGNATGSPLDVFIPIEITVHDLTPTPRIVSGVLSTTLDLVIGFELYTNVEILPPYNTYNTAIQVSDVQTTIVANSTAIVIEDDFVNDFFKAFKPEELVAKEKEKIENMIDEELIKLLEPALKTLSDNFGSRVEFSV
eukprot:Pgem_evm1s3029